MILAMCLSTNLLLLIFTVVSPLKLHLFEMIFIWIIVTFLHQMFYYYVTQNYHFWKTPEELNLLWGLVVTRMVCIPFLFFWLIDFSRRYSCASLCSGAALFIVFFHLMVGIDYLMDYAKVVNFVIWSVWYSYAEWFFISVISLLLMRWYCHILRREKFI